MDCDPVPNLLDGPGWVYEIKLDGYRAVAVKSDRDVNLFSRRHKSFNHQYPYLVEALNDLPGGTVVDGEVVALDESGRPNFNLLQSFRKEALHIHYFIFDMLICDNRDLTRLALSERRQLMKSHLKLYSPRIRIAEQFDVSANDMLAAVRKQQLEGIVGKRRDSLYEPGKRTGAWIKYRVNRGQELVIGGYVLGPHGFDSLIVGYYRGKDLIYVARVRNGFVPASRRQVFEKIRPLASSTMPFANLPDTHKSRWGAELTAEKMKDCVWLRPEAVAQIEFLERTEADRLRHSKFVALRDDKNAREVIKEA
ncbi:MAG TPA: non-homologous end-joining DNA ligase [Terriglobales bacterium]|nr:non-homologous end-joining DNA ligase [Terriglobales bacterium]